MELCNADMREDESPDGLIFNQCDETMARGKYPSVHPINKSMFWNSPAKKTRIITIEYCFYSKERHLFQL